MRSERLYYSVGANKIGDCAKWAAIYWSLRSKLVIRNIVIGIGGWKENLS